MTVEALSGLPSNVIPFHSPHQRQQEEGSQSPRFIQSKKDIIRDLVDAGPIELFFDAVSLHQDFWQGLVEHRQLLSDPIYWGEDENVPRGDGSKVYLLGGFATSPWMYKDTVRALQRNGYDAVALPWGVNVKPVRQMGCELLPKIWEEFRSSGHKVKLIGHSLGGFDWAAMFLENPEMFIDSVDHVIFDASPRPTRVNGALAFAYLIIRWFNREDDFEVGKKWELLKNAQSEGLVRATTIGSSRDLVIDGEHLGRDQDHFEITKASHAALGSNPDSVKIFTYRFAGCEVPQSPRIRQGAQAA